MKNIIISSILIFFLSLILVFDTKYNLLNHNFVNILPYFMVLLSLTILKKALNLLNKKTFNDLYKRVYTLKNVRIASIVSVATIIIVLLNYFFNFIQKELVTGLLVLCGIGSGVIFAYYKRFNTN